MLTEDELAALESLVRARAAAGLARYESGGTVNVGDLVARGGFTLADEQDGSLVRPADNTTAQVPEPKPIQRETRGRIRKEAP